MSDDDANLPRVQPIQLLANGKPHNIKAVNYPLRFRIELASGSYLEGLIPVNSSLTLCLTPNNEIAKTDIIVDPMSPITAAPSDG